MTLKEGFDRRRTACVTGASRGIGFELAKCFAHDGYNLVLVARSTGDLEKLAEELTRRHGVAVKIITKDLTEDGGAQDVYEELKREGIRVQVLVNNAGFAYFGPFRETDLRREESMMRLNMMTLTRLTKLFLKDMVREKEGKILNVASTAAFQPGPFMAVYYATKAYVLSFSEALANELRGTGVTVTCLCPGPTRTAFQEVAGIEGALIWSSSLVMDAAAVAKSGYRALQKGKTLVIPGFGSRLFTFLVRLGPRAFVTECVRYIQQRRPAAS